MKLRHALAVLALSASCAHAASFDCAKAASPAEKAICADADLSAQDSALAQAYRQALGRAGNADALRASQRIWLAQRDACGGNRACLGQRYRERLHALGASGEVEGGATAWLKRWERDTPNPNAGARLAFSGTAPRLHFTLEANSGANSGSLQGTALLQGQQASYRNGACRLDFSLQGQRLDVRQQGGSGDCGAGNGVVYGGSYVPAGTHKASPDLLSLKVLATPAQDQAAHALLGADYQTLVEAIGARGDEQDLDGLGAKVTGYFVQGVANSQAALVMSKDAELWIGLLVIDSANQVRTRYYTNVPAWKQRLPKTIRQWHDNIDKSMPIDMP